MPVQTPLQSKGGTEGWGGKGGEGGLGQRGLKLPTNCPYSSQRDKEHPQKELCPFPSVQPPTTPAELGCSSFAKKNPPKLWYNVWSPCAAISPCYFPLFPPAFSGQGPPFQDRDHLFILCLYSAEHPGAYWRQLGFLGAPPTQTTTTFKVSLHTQLL